MLLEGTANPSLIIGFFENKKAHRCCFLVRCRIRRTARRSMYVIFMYKNIRYRAFVETRGYCTDNHDIDSRPRSRIFLKVN